MTATNVSFTLRLRESSNLLPLRGRRPLIMAIINLNDDSFSGDGTLDTDLALLQARKALEEGADIIDIGAESARTNRQPITEDAEIARLRPFLEGFKSMVAGLQPASEDQIWPPALSVNTWRPRVAREALRIGGDILNDMGALPTDANARICAETGAVLLIMHSVGEPKVPHRGQHYPDIMSTLLNFFEEKIAMARAAGLSEEQIILDPGIDFAKDAADNLTIYRECGQLLRFGLPIMLPVSRKTVIGDVLDLPEPMDRDSGTVACIVRGQQAGAHIFRVHNVAAAVAATRTVAGIMG
jgi:dihydropteroate synthase